MSSDLRRVNLYVTSEQWRQLQDLKERTGAPLAESVRRAIDDYIARHLKPEGASAVAKESSDGRAKGKKSR
jgi:hypothetical protein